MTTARGGVRKQRSPHHDARDRRGEGRPVRGPSTQKNLTPRPRGARIHSRKPKRPSTLSLSQLPRSKMMLTLQYSKWQGFAAKIRARCGRAHGEKRAPHHRARTPQRQKCTASHLPSHVVADLRGRRAPHTPQQQQPEVDPPVVGANADADARERRERAGGGGGRVTETKGQRTKDGERRARKHGAKVRSRAHRNGGGMQRWKC